MCVLKENFRVNISPAGMKKALKELAPNAFRLFLYYHTKSDGWVFRPDDMAKEMGISVRTVQYAKAQLIKQEYLFIEHEKRVDSYYLGPATVKKHKKKWGID